MVYGRCSVIATLLLLSFLAPAPQALSHTFVYDADKDLQSVSVAGTFNNWDKGATPMHADGRHWSATVSSLAGKIQYKFVLNGSDWILDPKNPNKFDDGNGNSNSLLTVVPDDYSQPAQLDDGVITQSALYHDQSPSYLNFDRGFMTFRLRVRPNDVSSVSVVVNGQSQAMEPIVKDEFYQTDQAAVPWDGKSDLQYYFNLSDGSKTIAFGPKGVMQDPQRETGFRVDPHSYQPIQIPDWPEHSVIYQIFPDRFANGDKSNDPPNVADWSDKPTYENFYGGDTAGVRQHLDYLKQLGIKAVYFNPIFSSPSNHRYETIDYFKIDPRFGTNEEFATLTKTMQADGIKTIVDGVFNHTSPQFFAFQDIVKFQQASAYKSWYTIKSYPVKVMDPPPYEAWFGFSSLPKLHMSDPTVQNYMLTIPEIWDKKADIAGWRLDVPNEVVDSYWPKFRQTVKSTNPNRWIIGEIWGDGSHWLQGNMFDSIMGYQFRSATLDFIADRKIGPTEYLNRLMGIYTSYAPQVSRNLMNLLSSHDTERFMTLCGNDAGLAKLGATLQLTWVGAPSIYYGEELGMEGGKDPDNRRGMRWDLANGQNSMLTYYEKLIHARENSQALQIGDPVPLLEDDAAETLAYGRKYGRDVAVVAMNRSTSDRSVKVPLKDLEAKETKFEDVLSGRSYTSENGSLNISLPARSAAVLVPVVANMKSGRGMR
jgi:glycosidase